MRLDAISEHATRAHLHDRLRRCGYRRSVHTPETRAGLLYPLQEAHHELFWALESQRRLLTAGTKP